jgi:hypothetical protein
MRRFSALVCACALLAPAVMRGQGTPRGFWAVAGGDAAHSSWQRAETQITTETVTNNFKFLWKLKLGSGNSFSEPLLVPGMITGRGFKDFLFIADANTLYGVDSELGSLVWQHDLKLQPGAQKGCAGANIQLATEAPQVIHFGAKRPAGSRPPPPPPPEEPMPAASRRVGVAAGGGYFGLKGVYALTSDGYIHEQIMATGLDYAPPVKFLSSPGGSSFGLNMNDKIVYATQGTGCRGAASVLSSIDLNTPEYAINRYKAQTLSGLTGPSIGADGTAYVFTGSGPVDPAAGLYGDSVVALANDLKVKDWYTAGGQSFHASPVVFTYREKELIAAPGKDGTLVLLNSESLGGPDHHTPLAQTEKIFKIDKHQEWESLANWQDRAGVVWILASVSGAVISDAKFAQTNGPATHGSVVAFKVEEKDGHTVLTPAWISRDLVNPAPPVAANGIVFALEGGKSHAILYALDAATGKQLYTSGDAIQTYTHLAGMAVGDGHVFFTTRDNTLYSFGIPLEH